MRLDRQRLRRVAVRCVLVLAGLSAALAIGEVAVRVLLPPEQGQALRRRAELFRQIGPGQEYRRMEGGRIRRFPARAMPGERRLFIVGESVAEYFDETLLETMLRDAYPDTRWRVVNWAEGGSDSTDVWRAFRAVVRHRPDLVLVMVGNNEGPALFPPPLARVLRSRVLQHLRSLRVLEGFLTARWGTARGGNALFAENVRSILVHGSARGIPLVICTLPWNHRMPWAGGAFEDRSFFTAWWLMHHDPRRALPLLRSRLAADQLVSAWYVGRCHELLGDESAAERYYRLSDLPAREERNRILREEAAAFPQSCVVCDFDARVRQLGNGAPGFAFFFDNMHYWPDAYALLSREVIDGVAAAAAGSGNRLFKPFAGPALSPQEPRASYAPPSGTFLMSGRNPYVYSGLFSTGGGYPIIETLKELLRARCGGNRAAIHRYAALVRAGSRFASRSDYAVRLCVIGELLREERALASALPYLDEAVRCAPRVPSVWLFRGLCRYDRGDRTGAAADMAVLQTLDPAFQWLSVEYLDSLGVRGRE